MALFDRFKRNKNQDSVMPAEVQDYYKAERRDKTGMAWMLAIATLLATILIAAGLFFGGRFVYRAIFDNNDESTQTQTENGNKTEESGASTAPSGESQTSSDSNGGGQTSSTNTTTTPPTTTPPANTPTTTPNTGPTELINTGPGDE